jgi:hypothetical protein
MSAKQCRLGICVCLNSPDWSSSFIGVLRMLRLSDRVRRSAGICAWRYPLGDHALVLYSPERETIPIDVSSPNRQKESKAQKQDSKRLHKQTNKTMELETQCKPKCCKLGKTKTSRPPKKTPPKSKESQIDSSPTPGKFPDRYSVLNGPNRTTKSKEVAPCKAPGI